MQRRVVVTGIGVLCPLGLTSKEAWLSLIDSKSGIAKLDSEYDALPCQVAATITKNNQRFQLLDHYSNTELKSMGSATGYALLAADQAIKDSQLEKLPQTTKTRTGVAVGMGMVDLDDICKTNDLLRKSYKQVSPFFVPRILPNMAAGQISIKYGFQGPNHCVSTACASGAHAIGDSFRFIRTGDAELMVCGASEACISPLAVAAFCRLRALSTSFNGKPEEASRPFDDKRDGFVMGEGSAILVLEELEHALKRNVHIYAEVLGYGLSGDASHLTAPNSEGSGAFLAMQRAIQDAKIQLEDVGYINAHATSTPVGDTIELKAIRKLFAKHSQNLYVSSTKGAHGHLLGAAGSLESTFTIKAVEEGIIPPTLNLENHNEQILKLVANLKQEWKNGKKRIALKNAFGFGGTNAALCISQYIN